ncbi:MAG: DUF4277 domain-containing protein [Spirosomaceae bacterium]|jgi:transposase|nr:DUF4277 domain-containing protein [Spirosomataceae bacterium]
MATLYSSKTLDHLGLLAGMCEELHLIDEVNTLLPTDTQKRVPHGEAIVAMILNGLGFVNKRLYLMPKFFEDKPVGLLLNNSQIEAQHLNDDALGRTLDAIANFGTTAFFHAISRKAVAQWGNQSPIAHLDITNRIGDPISFTRLIRRPNRVADCTRT